MENRAEDIRPVCFKLIEGRDRWPVEGIQKLEEEKSLRAAYCGSHTKIPLTTERKKHGYGGV